MIMQTCNMDERTNEEKLRDHIATLDAEIERLKGVSLPLVDCYSCCEANIAKPSLHKHHDERFELTLLVRDCPNCGAFSETLSTEIPKEQGE